MMGAAVIGGVNLSIRAINGLVQGALSGINSMIEAANKIPGVDIGKIGQGGVINEIANDYADRLSGATAQRNAAVRLAMEKDYIGALGERFTSLRNASQAEAQLAAATAKSSASTAGATGATKAATKALKEFEQERQRSLQAQYDEIAKLDEQATALERQALYFGYSEQALNDLTIARLEEQKAALMGFEGAEEQIAILDRQIDAYKRMGMAMGDIATKEQQKADWEAWARDVDQIFQQVGQSLTDAIFEGGKSGKDLLKDVFKGITFNVVINPVMQGLQGFVTNQIGGLLGYSNPQQQAGGFGGTGNLLSAGKSAWDLASGGLNASAFAGNSLIGFGMDVGSQMAIEFGSGLASNSSISAFMGAAKSGGTQMAGAFAGALGNAFAGYGISKSLSGGLSIGNGASDYVAAALSAIPGVGPVAALPIAAINRTFGLGAKETTGQGMAGWVKGSRGGQDVLTYETATRKGGWARGDSDYLDFSAGDAGMQSAIGQLVTETSQSLKAYADALNLNTQDIQEYAKHIFIPTMDRSAEEIQQNILSEVNLYAQELTRDFWPALQEVRRGGEELTDTLARVATAVQGVNPVLEALGLKAFDVSLQGGVLASSLVDLFGGMEGFATATSSYYDAFYSEQEKFDNGLKAMSARLGEIGVVLPDLSQSTDDVRKQYRAMIEAQDLSTEIGQRNAAILIQNSTAVLGLSEAATSLAESAKAAEESVQDMTAILNERAGLERQLMQLLGDVAGIRALELEALDPSNRALQERIWAVQKETEAAERARAVATERAGLEAQYLQLTGDTAELRRRELDALDPLNRALQESIWLIQDEQAARTAAVSVAESAYAALSRSVSAEKSRLQKESQAIAEALRSSISAASETVSELTSLTGRLTSTVQGMAGQLDEGRNFAWAQDRVERALSVAKLTGVMPQGADFDRALDIVAEPSEGLYRSFEDYQTDFLKTAHTVNALNELADGQLTTAQRSLDELENQLQHSQLWYQSEIERLDLMLEQERQAIDIALGTYQTVLTIPQALSGIQSAIAGLNMAPVINIPSAIPPASVPTQGGGSAGSGGGSKTTYGSYAEYMAGNPDLALAYLSMGGASYKPADVWAKEHWEQYGKYENRPVGLRSFDVGTNRVPFDMVAQIHRDERIIPAADNRQLMRMLDRGSSQSDDIRLLQQEIKELRAMLATKLDEGNRNTRDVAQTNRRMIEQPTPVAVTNIVPTVAVTPGA